MSKLYIYSICISISGVVLSFIILLHEGDVINAGSAAYCSSCAKAVVSPYSFIAGIPVAAAGLAWFILLLLVSVYMYYKDDETVRRSGAVMLLVLGLCGMAADMFMGSMMVVYRVFCPLCFATYFVNIFIVIIALLMLRFYKIKVREQGFLTDVITGLTRIPRVERYLLAVLLLMIVPLTYTVNGIVKPPERQAVNGNARNFVNSIYEKPAITDKLPDSAMIIGEGSDVIIAVFTDFNCPSCKRLFNSLKSIVTKYPGMIRVAFYNFPLDKKCNSYIDTDYYTDSCARAVNNIAVSGKGKFSGSFVEKDNFVVTAVDRRQAASVLKRDIELYRKLKLTAVPAIIINGRIIEGNPGREVLEAVIGREINNIRN